MNIADLLIISVSCSAVILILLVLRPFADRRVAPAWRYFVWLIIALRLVFPFRFEVKNAPVSIPAKNYNVVLTTNSDSFTAIMDDEELKAYTPKNPGDSADGAPIATLEEVIFEIWLCGAVLFTSFHLISLILFKIRIKPHMKKIEQNVYICEKIGTPMVVGFFKPTVLIPDKKYTDDELRLIIKHEMTHFKRLDVWYKLLIMIANAMHWFNPAVYFMAKAATRDMEFFCDMQVIKNADENTRKNYSLAILKSMKKE